MSDLFIIGAGASVPYGFPCGKELVEKIERLFIDGEFKKKVLGTTLRLKDGNKGENLIDLKLLRKIIEEMKAFSMESIDDFIRNRTDQGYEYNFAIKRVIAAIILYYEQNFRKIETENKDKKMDYGWIGFLCNYLDRNEDGFPVNFVKSKFLTFNYDRVFEHIIFRYLTITKRDDNNLAIEEINSSGNIIHMYGYLGTLDSIEFGTERIDNSVPKNLETVWDNTNNQYKKLRVMEYISRCERIFFLGFGYLLENLKTLGIEEGSNILNGKHIRGTAFGLSNDRVLEATEILRGCGATSVELYDCDVNRLIKDYI